MGGGAFSLIEVRCLLKIEQLSALNFKVVEVVMCILLFLVGVDLCCKTRAITVSFLRKFISRSVRIAKLCCQYLVCLKVLLTANITSRHSLVNVNMDSFVRSCCLRATGSVFYA